MRLLALVLKLASGLVAAAAFAFGAGFLIFASDIPRAQTEPPRADGIVALTGGANRVTDALHLLAEGRARRLLISGVHPATTLADLMRETGAERRLFACCVDLDHEALDTIGNAVETGAWARRHGVRSLIVVTSAYHMPRSLAELGHQMPGVALHPHPVVSPNLDLDRWWAHGETARLLMVEYLKFLLSSGRRIMLAHGGRATLPAHG
jgi:uncharacterized SAM-binding protein YcdF (DUF218 family)